MKWFFAILKGLLAARNCLSHDDGPLNSKYIFSLNFSLISQLCFSEGYIFKKLWEIDDLKVSRFQYTSM